MAASSRRSHSGVPPCSGLSREATQRVHVADGFQGRFPHGRLVVALPPVDDHRRSLCATLLGAAGLFEPAIRDRSGESAGRLSTLRPSLVDVDGQRDALGGHPTVAEVTRSCRSEFVLRHNIRVIHGRPYHPETQGKEERFHRTLQAEVLRGQGPSRRTLGRCSGSSIVGVRRITTSVLTRPWG